MRVLNRLLAHLRWREEHSGMRYEVGESEAYPSYFSVDAINYEGDGEIYTTVFFGSRSRERAEEYAAWQNAQSAATSNDKYLAAAR